MGFGKEAEKASAAQDRAEKKFNEGKISYDKLVETGNKNAKKMMDDCFTSPPAGGPGRKAPQQVKAPSHRATHGTTS